MGGLGERPGGDDPAGGRGLHAVLAGTHAGDDRRCGQDAGEHIFTIIDLATEQAIGRGMLFSIDLVNRGAMLGIIIGEKAYWGKGYGTDATRLLLEYTFTLLNLNSVMLGVFTRFNERAIACYRRVGFREIGRRRQARIIGGQKHDAILMDILAEEFAPRRVIL